MKVDESTDYGSQPNKWGLAEIKTEKCGCCTNGELSDGEVCNMCLGSGTKTVTRTLTNDEVGEWASDLLTGTSNTGNDESHFHNDLVILLPEKEKGK